MGQAETEPPAAGGWLKRLLLQLVDRAMFDVDDLKDHPDEALHRLRLRMKKADALLRLSKGAARKTARWRLREQIRKVKNICGSQRDAAVVAKLAHELGRKRGLYLVLPPIVHAKPNARKLHAGLSELRRELAEQIFDGLTWDDVGDNYAACYRSGRRRMREAEETGNAEAFHRWRKRAKALYYQTQALHGILAHPQHRLRRTRKLGKLLGREHDLILLEEETSAKSPANPWLEVINARREKLRPQILALGGSLYRQPAHRFARLCD